MAQAFNINARLSLQGPYNVQPVVQSIRRQVENIPANLDFKLSPNSAKAIGNLSQGIGGLTAQIRGANQEVDNIGRNLAGLKVGQGASRGLDQFGKQAKSAVPEVRSLDTAISGVKSQSELAGEVFGSTARRLGLFIVAAKAFQIVSSGLADATTKALAFQNEMVRLSQIGGTSASSISAVSTEITRLATNLGTSSQDLSEVAVTLRQAGLSADETKTALEALAKTTLAPTFESLKNTTEGVIAMRQQFDVSSEDIVKRLGSINTVAGEFAVESEDLVTAIRKAGGAFKSASGDMVSSEQSFNQLLALFTSVRNTTRESADEIATGLRTIFARVQSTSVSNSLKEMGVNLRFTREESRDFGRDVTGQFVGAYEAVRRLSAATQDLPTTDPRYSQIVEQLGGFRQISRVIPLLQQFGTAQKAYTVAQAGANSLTTDAAKAQDSFLVKLTKVKEEFFDLIRTLSGNKTFQTMIDYFLKGTSAALGLAKSLEPIVPLITTIAAVKIGSSLLSAGKGALSQITEFRGAASLNRRKEQIDPTLIRRRGGGIIPGHGTGDKVPLLAEPGEFVLNRKASKSIGYAALAKWNGGGYDRKETPRFADGGQTKFPIVTEPGEYYFDRRAVGKIGLSKLHQANRTGKLPRDVADKIDPRERLAAKIKDIGGMRATLRGFTTGGQIKTKDNPNKTFPHSTPLLQPLDPRERLALKLKAMGRLGDAWKERSQTAFASGGVTQTPSTRVLDWDRIRKLRDLEQGVNGEAPMKVDGFSRLRRRFEMDPDTKQPTARAKYYATSRSARYAMGRGFPIPDKVKKLLGRATGGATDDVEKKLLDLQKLLGELHDDIAPQLQGEKFVNRKGGGAQKIARQLDVVNKNVRGTGDPVEVLLDQITSEVDPQSLENLHRQIRGGTIKGGRLGTDKQGNARSVQKSGLLREAGVAGPDLAIRLKMIERAVKSQHDKIKEGLPEASTVEAPKSGDALSHSIHIPGDLSRGQEQRRVGNTFSDDEMERELADERLSTHFDQSINKPARAFDPASRSDVDNAFRNDASAKTSLGLSSRLGRASRPIPANIDAARSIIVPKKAKQTTQSGYHYGPNNPTIPEIPDHIKNPGTYPHPLNLSEDSPPVQITRVAQEPENVTPTLNLKRVKSATPVETVSPVGVRQTVAASQTVAAPTNKITSPKPKYVPNVSFTLEDLSGVATTPPSAGGGRGPRIPRKTASGGGLPDDTTPPWIRKLISSLDRLDKTVNDSIKQNRVSPNEKPIRSTRPSRPVASIPDPIPQDEDTGPYRLEPKSRRKSPIKKSKPSVRKTGPTGIPLDKEDTAADRMYDPSAYTFSLENHPLHPIPFATHNMGSTWNDPRIRGPKDTYANHNAEPEFQLAGPPLPPPAPIPPYNYQTIENEHVPHSLPRPAVRRPYAESDRRFIGPRREFENLTLGADTTPPEPQYTTESLPRGFIGPANLAPSPTPRKTRVGEPIRRSNFQVSPPTHPIPLAEQVFHNTTTPTSSRTSVELPVTQGLSNDFLLKTLTNSNPGLRPTTPTPRRGGTGYGLAEQLGAISLSEPYNEYNEPSYKLQAPIRKTRRPLRPITLDESKSTIPFADEAINRSIVPPRPPKAARRPIDSYSLNQPTLQPANADRTRKALQDFYEQTLKQRRGDLSADDIKKFASQAVTRQEARGGIEAVDNSLKRFTSKDLRSKGKDGSREGADFFNAYSKSVNPDNNYEGRPDDVNADLNKFYHARINEGRTRTPARAAKLQNYIVQRQADRGAQVLNRQDPYGVDIPYVDKPLTRFKSGGVLGRTLKSASRLAHTNIPVPFKPMMGQDGVTPATRGERFGRIINGGAAGVYGTTVAASYIQDAYGGDQNDAESLQRNKGQSALSGGVTGAALGAQVGSMVPIPGGTAIGAVAGLIIGFGTSVANVDKQIKQIKLDKSLQGLARAIDDVVSGRIDAGSAAQAINKKVTGVREDVTSQTEGTGGNFFNSFSNFLENWTPNLPGTGVSLTSLGNTATRLGVSAVGGAASAVGLGFDHDANTSVFGNSAQDRAKSQFNAQQSKEQELLGPMLPQLRQSMELLASSIKLSDKDLNTTTGSPDKRSQRADLLNQNGGRELMETISRVEKVPINQVVREFDATLLRSNKARVTNENAGKSANDSDLQARRFERLGSALDAAALSLKKFQSAADAIETLAQGQVGTTAISGISEQTTLGGIDDQRVKNTTSFARTSLGDVGSGIVEQYTKTIEEIDRVKRELPGLLTKASKGSDFSENNIIGDVSKAFDGFSPDIQKKLETKLNSMDAKTVTQDLTTNPEKFAQTLTDPFKEAESVWTGIIKQLEEAPQKFAGDLGRASLLQNQAGATRDRSAEAGLGVVQAQTQLVNAKTGRSNQVGLDDLLQPFNSRQTRLAGTAANPFDADSISTRLQTVQKKALEQGEKANDVNLPGKDRKQAQVEFTRLTNESANLQKALEHLGDTSGRLSAIQTKIAEAEKVRSSQLSLTERLLTGDTASKIDFQRGKVGATVAAQQGSFAGFSPENAKLALDALRAFGDIKFNAGPLKGFTGNGAAEKLISNTAGQFGIDTNSTQRQIVGLHGNALGVQEEGLKATKAQGTIQDALARDFFKKINDGFDKFFKDADKRLAQADVKDKQTDVDTATAKVAQTAAQAETARKVTGEYGSLANARQIASSPDLKELSQSQADLGRLAKIVQPGGVFTGAEQEIQKSGTVFGKTILPPNELRDRTDPKQREAFLGGEQERLTKFRPDISAKSGLSSQEVDAGLIDYLGKLRGHVEPGGGADLGRDFSVQDEFLKSLRKSADDSGKQSLAVANSKTTSISQGVYGNTDGVSVGRVKKAAANSFELGESLKTIPQDVKSSDAAEKAFNVQNDRLAASNEALRKSNEKLAQVMEQAAPPTEVVHKAKGGSIFKPRGSDTVPAMLTPGEFVVKADQAKANHEALHAINSGSGPVYKATGGGILPSDELRKKLRDQMVRSNQIKSVVAKQTDVEHGKHETSLNALYKARTEHDNRKPSIIPSGGRRIGPSDDAIARAAQERARRNRKSGDQDDAPTRHQSRRYRQDYTPRYYPPKKSRQANRRYASTSGSFSVADNRQIGNEIDAYLTQYLMGFAGGGMVPKGTDAVPAMLTKGEYVVDRQTASAHLPLLQKLKPEYRAGGGLIGDDQSAGGGSGVSSQVMQVLTTLPNRLQNAFSALDKSIKPLASLSQTFADFNDSQRDLSSSLTTWSRSAGLIGPSLVPFVDAASKLAQAINSSAIPSEIKVNTNNKVEVLINGAQVLASIKGDMAEVVMQAVMAKLSGEVKRIIAEMPG